MELEIYYVLNHQIGSVSYEKKYNTMLQHIPWNMDKALQCLDLLCFYNQFLIRFLWSICQYKSWNYPNTSELDDIWKRLKSMYLNLGVLKSFLHHTKLYVFYWMGKILCMEFQTVPLKSHTKCLTHTLKDENMIQFQKIKKCQI